MKKIFALFFTFLLFSNISAQNEPQVGFVSKFGIAGGFTPVWIMPNIDALNAQLPGIGVGKLSTGGVIGYGGAGYAYLMFVENLRIGGMGFGGSISSGGKVDGFNKEVKYSIGLGGLTVEYALPFIKKVSVSVGAIIGAGSVKIEIYQNKNDFSWNDLFDELSDSTKSTKNISRTLKNNFFTITPTINVDIPVNRFIAFRVGGGYLLPFNNDWNIGNEQELKNVPDDLTGRAFFVQAGIFMGFFAF
jgi:hypothetical protein